MICSTISYTDLPAMAATSYGSHGKCAFVVPHVLPPKLCRELWFQHLTCAVPGYRPGLNVWWSLVVGWRLWCVKCVYLLWFFFARKIGVILGPTCFYWIVTNGRKSKMLLWSRWETNQLQVKSLHWRENMFPNSPKPAGFGGFCTCEYTDIFFIFHTRVVTKQISMCLLITYRIKHIYYITVQFTQDSIEIKDRFV